MTRENKIRSLIHPSSNKKIFTYLFVSCINYTLEIQDDLN